MFKTMRFVDDYAQIALVDEQTFYMINVCVCVCVCVCACVRVCVFFTYVSSFGII